MRTLVAILTRNNPIGLTTLVNSLDELAESPADIVYAIRHDEDDGESDGAIWPLQHRLKHRLIHFCRPRPVTLGAAWNETLAAVPSWDIAIPFPDDIIPLCDRWDTVVRVVAQDFPIFSWRQTISPTLPTYPTLTRQYYEAVSRALFPEWFPFWESDRWVWETYQLAFGKPMPLIENLWLGGKKSPTKNMREVDFWFEFYDATRNNRIKEAAGIRAHFPNTPAFDLDEIIKSQERIYAHHMSRAELYQKSNNPNPGPPSKEYLLAKARAVAYLADRPLPVAA